jgi:hypothetical protein
VVPSPASAQLNHVSHTASASVSVFRPPAPAAPTGVQIQQSQDQLIVSWMPAAATAADITSSTITAAPTGGSSAPVLTATVSGAAATGSVSGVLPSTQYSVTVVNATSGGVGPASQPVLFTTGVSSNPPASPTGLRVFWTYNGTASELLTAVWTPGAPGDSPIDQYEVMATSHDSDTPQTVTGTVSAPTTSIYLSVDDLQDWSVQVRAHNAAGWGPWSSAAMLGGI